MTSIVLRLEGSCIETTARRAYREIVDGLLAGDAEDPEVERRAALLEEFLETHDFPAIRASDPDLSGETPIRVRIARAPSGRVVYEKLGPA